MKNKSVSNLMTLLNSAKCGFSNNIDMKKNY